MKALYLLTLCLLTVSLVACNLPTLRQAAPVSLGGGGPQTWVDAPLNKMHIPLAPYEVVFHASDNSSITKLELKINDQAAPVGSPPGADNNLVTIKYLWSPPAPGEYVLRARSQNGAGIWSDDAVVTVWVGDLTPTVTLTPTPTTTATATVTPTPALAGLTFIPNLSANEFHYGRCSPSSIDITLTVSGADIDSVVLFVKLNEQGGSGSTGWNSYNSMKPLGNGAYRITVVSSSIDGFDNYNAAWMVYQFVAMKNNNIVGRSDSYKNVALTACGTPSLLIPQPPILIIPSNTPQVVK